MEHWQARLTDSAQSPWTTPVHEERLVFDGDPLPTR
jgi:hypothetical protein